MKIINTIILIFVIIKIVYNKFQFITNYSLQQITNYSSTIYIIIYIIQFLKLKLLIKNFNLHKKQIYKTTNNIINI